MQILVTGVRHKMASIEVREQFALMEDEIGAATQALMALPAIRECAILTTCNRCEIYAVVTDIAAGQEAIRQFYQSFKGISVQNYRRHLFTLLYEDAALHLFRVASGLDSLILGEAQILGQVKDTLTAAQKHGSAGTVLDRLFKVALTVGKRVRHETGIAEKDISVSRAAYKTAKKLDPDLLNRKIALVGGGKMASLVMASLKHEMSADQLKNVMIVNRSEQRLNELNEKYGFQGRSWGNLPQVLAEADVLFVATGAPHVILGPKHFENATSKLIVDIAVPRNVDPRVADLPGVRLINTDSLGTVTTLTQESQEALKIQARKIITEEYAGLRNWWVARQAAPAISMLHARVEDIRRQEVAGGGTDVDALSKSLVKKILHTPTMRLRESGSAEAVARHIDSLHHLFDMNPDQPDSPDNASYPTTGLG